jgi:predicted permease
MANLFLVLLIIFMALALGSLLVGVFAMGKGGDYNKKNSNKLMRYRVLFQGLAIASFILYLLAR